MTKIETLLKELEHAEARMFVTGKSTKDNLETAEKWRRTYQAKRQEIVDYVNDLETQLARQLQPHSYGDCPVCGEVASFLLDHQTMTARCTNPVCGYITEIE